MEGCGAEKPENAGVVAAAVKGELETGAPKGEEVVGGCVIGGLAMDKSSDTGALVTKRLPPPSENRLSGLPPELGGFSDGSSKMVL